jgi:hypothetical protein
MRLYHIIFVQLLKIEFVKHDPELLMLVKIGASLLNRWHHNANCVFARRGRGNAEECRNWFAPVVYCSEHNRRWPRLAALTFSSALFANPKVVVLKHRTRLHLLKDHGSN